jgi:hypothetical protein
MNVKTTSIQSLDSWVSRGYKPRLFIATERSEGRFDPVGVMVFEKRGTCFRSVVYERFGTWLYATPEKVRAVR